MKAFILLISSVSLVCLADSARGDFSAAHSANEDANYLLAKGLCSKQSRLNFQMIGNSALSAVQLLAWGNFMSFRRLYANRGLTDSTVALMQTDGYRNAVGECFGGDVSAQARFESRLRLNDVIGGMIAVAGIYGSGYAAYRGAVRLGAMAGFSAKMVEIALVTSSVVGAGINMVYRYDLESRRQVEMRELNQTLNDLLAADIPLVEQDIAIDEALLKDPRTNVKDRQGIADELATLKSIRDRLMASTDDV